MWVESRRRRAPADRRLPVRLLVAPPPPPVETSADLDTPAVAGTTRLLAEGPGQRDRGGGLRHRAAGSDACWPPAAASARSCWPTAHSSPGRTRTRPVVALHADVLDTCRRRDDRSRAARPDVRSDLRHPDPGRRHARLAAHRRAGQVATISDLRSGHARRAPGRCSGRGLVGPGFDGATVVWAQPAPRRRRRRHGSAPGGRRGVSDRPRDRRRPVGAWSAATASPGGSAPARTRGSDGRGCRHERPRPRRRRVGDVQMPAARRRASSPSASPARGGACSPVSASPASSCSSGCCSSSGC